MREIEPGDEGWLSREVRTLCVGGPVLLVPVCGDVRPACLEPFATFDLHARDYVTLAIQRGVRSEPPDLFGFATRPARRHPSQDELVAARERAWERLAQELGIPADRAARLARQHLDEGRLEVLFLVAGRWVGSHEAPVGHSESEPVPLAFDLRQALAELADAGRALHVPGFDELAPALREALEFPAGPLGPPLRPPRIRVRVEEVPTRAPPERRESARRPGIRVEEVVLPRRPRREEPPRGPGVQLERMPGVRARLGEPPPPPSQASAQAAAPPASASQKAPENQHVVDGGTCVRCGRKGAELAGECTGPRHGRMGMIELD